MKIAVQLIAILCLNLVALIVICVLFKIFQSDSPAFIFVFIFGIKVNPVLLPLNLLTLIWLKLRWWIVAISVVWCALIFDPFSPEAILVYGFIVINQLAFWVVTREEQRKL